MPSPSDISNPPGVKETFVPRSSSNISEFTYDPSVENLEVTFVSGETYTYFNVPPGEYRNWCAEGGSGSYFHRRIRTHFSYERQ